jgi:hypothetical protein
MFIYRNIGLVLMLATAAFGIRDFSVSLTRTGSVFVVQEQSTAALAGGFGDTNLIWVAANSQAAIENGSMSTPYKQFTAAVVTQNYDKTIIVCPGVYTFDTNISVRGNTHILGLSKNPDDVLFTLAYSTTNSLLFATGVHFSNLTFTLENVSLTTTNIYNGGTVPYRAIIGGTIGTTWLDGTNLNPIVDHVVLKNCKIKNCKIDRSSTSVSPIQGLTMTDCQVLNCIMATNASVGTIPFFRYCKLNNCLVTNVVVAKATSTAQTYIFSTCRLQDCIIDSCMSSNISIVGGGSAYATIMSSSVMQDSILRNCTIYGGSNYLSSMVLGTLSPGAYYDNLAYRHQNSLLYNNVCVVETTPVVSFNTVGGSIDKLCFLNNTNVYLDSINSRAFMCGLRYTDITMTNLDYAAGPSSNAVYGTSTNTGFCSEWEYY